MLIGLAIRDVVLIEALDLSPGPGLSALTGETGAGKSIILDALGLALGARGEAGLVRRGAAQAVVTAIFALSPDSPVWASLDEKGLEYDRSEDLVVRRVLTADGRSRAFVNDQVASVGMLKELGAMLVEVHGQHQTVGLLDARTHGGLLERHGGFETVKLVCLTAWSVWRDAANRPEALQADARRSVAEVEQLSAQLAELDRLAPAEGEVATLAEERAVMGAAEKILSDVAAARERLDSDDLSARVSHAVRALERASQRLAGVGSDPGRGPANLVATAIAAADRALVEIVEAGAAVDEAARALDFDPAALEQAEERLFALRAVARRLGVEPDALPAERLRIASELAALEDLDATTANAAAATAAARSNYLAAAAALTAAREAAGLALARAVQAEMAPLKLDRARFRVSVEPLPEERLGPSGADRIEFQIATLPGVPFQPLGQVASGGELARIALALKVCLAERLSGPQPLMIFDEVDQGVGGAVADAIGVRLRSLSRDGQVLVVTHSPQLAARANAQWRVRKAGASEAPHVEVDVLGPAAREEEIARMLSGAQVTEAARAAARALMDA